MRRQTAAPCGRSIRTRGGRASLAAAALFLLSLVLAPAALGATVYKPTGERFATPGSGPGEMNHGVQVAVDDATGYVLSADRWGTNVNVYAPAGDSAAYSTSFTDPEIGGIHGLAIDQGSRALYLIDVLNNRIRKYTIGGSGPLTFTPDPTFTSPLPGSGPGEIGYFASPLTVDPTNGDLLVADTGNQVVSRFDSSGAFVSSFDGTGSPAGRFHLLSSVAVDAAGAVYVVDINGQNIEYEYGESVVERFAPDGTVDSSFDPLVETPRTVAVDPNSGNLLVAGRSDGGYVHDDGSGGPYPVRLYVLVGDETLAELDFPAADAGSLVNGLAVDGGSTGRLYAVTAKGGLGGSVGIHAFDSFLVPDVVLDPPTAITTSGAHVSGSVNPLGAAASYHFEYSREGGPAKSTPEVAVGSGAAPVAVSADLTGLAANSDYEIRLVATATGSGTSITSPPRQLHTVAAPPLVLTGDAIDRSAAGVTLLGWVNPLGQQTTYRFEYGPTAAYGQQSPVDHEDVAGNGRVDLAVHAYLSGLQPSTEYHYRLVAENATGVAAGADRTFVTKAAMGPLRVYEQVSPVNKGGSDVNGLRGFYTTPDGEGLLYQWKAGPAGASSGPVSPRSFGWRSPDGWSSLGLDAEQLPGPAVVISPLLTFVLGVSPDGTKTITNSLAKLAPGAVEGESNLYLRDTRTGEYTNMFTTPGTMFYSTSSGLGGEPIVDGTPDYSHVLVRPMFQPLLPGGPFAGLYEWTDGELQLASVAPDGTPLGFIGAGGTAGHRVRDPHYISEDGSKVFFYSGETGQTYVRVDGEETFLIGGLFGGASRDGRYAYVYGRDLTSDSDPGEGYLYRYDTESHELELLTRVGSNIEANVQVSANGESVFFISGAALTPDAVEGEGNLYAWNGGEVHLIAARDIELDGYGAPQEYMASPNGRYFAFAAYTPLTGYDNSSETACVEFARGDPKDPVTGKGIACKQIFRFDLETEQLHCASCPRDGSDPTSGARMGPENVEGDYSFARAVVDNGTVIFDTTEPLSSRDSNSNRDVYTFDGTEAELISSGAFASRSEFDEASADGSSIFFTTQDQLVGQDTDTLADVYVARAGGGIASQNPPTPRGECIRDDCKATPNSGPELPFGGSEALSGPGNVRTATPRKRCGKNRKARQVKGRSRCVKQPKKQAKKKPAKSNRRQGR